MTSNTFSNKRSFLNTPPSFNGVIFELWKTRFKIFIQSIDIELWETLINDMFISIHQIDGEVADKSDSLWTVEENRKL